MKKGFILKHGECANYSCTKLYGVWLTMKYRTTNPNYKYFKNYGGRGITICKEWNDSSISFLKWARNNGYVEGLDIDRIDNNKGYCPDNCRFVTRSINLLNKRKRKDFGIYISHGKYFKIELRRNNKAYYGGVSNNIEEARKLRNDLFNKLNKITNGDSNIDDQCFTK